MPKKKGGKGANANAGINAGRGKKKGSRRKVGKGSVTFFMGQLIQAGYAGEEIPEEASEQRKVAQRLRQFAERLSMQTSKYGDEDVGVGGGDTGGDDDEGGEE